MILEEESLSHNGGRLVGRETVVPPRSPHCPPSISLSLSLSLLRPPRFHHSNYCADGTVTKKKLLVGVEVAARPDKAGRVGGTRQRVTTCWPYSSLV